MDPNEDEDKEKINRPAGSDNYQDIKKVEVRPAGHAQELRKNSDEHQHREEEDKKITRHDQEYCHKNDQDFHKNEIIRPGDDDDDPSEIQTSRIRIKLPKSKQQGEVVLHYQCSCTTCGKGFSSRKGWGGHWKTDLKEEKKKETIKNIRNDQLIMSKKLQNGGGGGGCWIINAGDHVCSICHREFKSSKALLAHMRTHPDRVCRGIRPPVKKSGAAASSDVDGYVDLSRDLIRWTRTGKQGRPSTYCGAANSLTNLASTLTKINNGARIEYQESASEGKKITISNSPTLYPQSKDQRAKAHLKSRDLKIERGDESVVQDFNCISCSRTFTSYQAPGGHRSYHSKEKIGDKNVVVVSSMEIDSEEESEKVATSLLEEENQVVSNVVAKEPGSRKILDFDLNELPDMDDKEEEKKKKEEKKNDN